MLIVGVVKFKQLIATNSIKRLNGRIAAIWVIVSKKQPINFPVSYKIALAQVYT